VHNISESDPF